jgi:hypothetical protein
MHDMIPHPTSIHLLWWNATVQVVVVDVVAALKLSLMIHGGAFPFLPFSVVDYVHVCLKSEGESTSDTQAYQHGMHAGRSSCVCPAGC